MDALFAAKVPRACSTPPQAWMSGHADSVSALGKRGRDEPQVGADGPTIPAIATAIRSLEDGLDWSSVRSSWSYKQKAWVTQLERIEDGGVSVSGEVQSMIRWLAKLARELASALKPAVLPPWWVTKQWHTILDGASEPQALMEVVGVLGSAMRGDASPPPLLATAAATPAPTPVAVKQEVGASAPVVKMEVDASQAPVMVAAVPTPPPVAAVSVAVAPAPVKQELDSSPAPPPGDNAPADAAAVGSTGPKTIAQRLWRRTTAAAAGSSRLAAGPYGSSNPAVTPPPGPPLPRANAAAAAPTAAPAAAAPAAAAGDAPPAVLSAAWLQGDAYEADDSANAESVDAQLSAVDNTQLVAASSQREADLAEKNAMGLEEVARCKEAASRFKTFLETAPVGPLSAEVKARVKESDLKPGGLRFVQFRAFKALQKLETPPPCAAPR